jgi:hypothetical protein
MRCRSLPGRKGRHQLDGGGLANQADFLYGQQQLAVDFPGLHAKVAGSAAGSTGRSSFKDKLVNIDFTVIDPNLSMDDSAKYQIHETRGAVRFGQYCRSWSSVDWGRRSLDP